MKSSNPYVVSGDSEDAKAMLQLLRVTGSRSRMKEHVFRVDYSVLLSPPFPDVQRHGTGIGAVLCIWVEKQGSWGGRDSRREG